MRTRPTLLALVTILSAIGFALPEAHAATLAERVAARRSARLQGVTLRRSHHDNERVTLSSSKRDARTQLLSLINAERAQAGLAALAIDEKLSASAQAYADDMAARAFFSHTDPDGRDANERILSAGYARPPCACSYRYWTGENLAKGQRTPEDAVADWMASPGHRANIVSADFSETGIGWNAAANMWVQHFGAVRALGQGAYTVFDG